MFDRTDVKSLNQFCNDLEKLEGNVSLLRAVINTVVGGGEVSSEHNEFLSKAIKASRDSELILLLKDVLGRVEKGEKTSRDDADALVNRMEANRNRDFPRPELIQLLSEIKS